MSTVELVNALQSMGVDVKTVTHRQPNITIPIDKYLELMVKLDRYSDNIEHLVDALSKLGITAIAKRSKLTNSISYTTSGYYLHDRNKLTDYDNVVQQMLTVSSQINHQYNLMVTDILGILDSNG